ncbi:MAG: hypothetical protein V4576_00550 [Patescibacteria group bacterium]
MKNNYPKLLGFILATIYFFNCVYNPATLNGNWHFINSLDLIIHEAGHALVPTSILGEVMTALGGSAFEILVPLVFAGYFLRRRDMFSASILAMWAAENIAYVSVYIGDSLKMNLNLLGGEAAIHDWNFILGHMNLLVQTDILAKIAYASAWILFVIAFSFGLNTFFKNEN